MALICKYVAAFVFPPNPDCSIDQCMSAVQRSLHMLWVGLEASQWSCRCPVCVIAWAVAVIKPYRSNSVVAASIGSATLDVPLGNFDVCSSSPPAHAHPIWDGQPLKANPLISEPSHLGWF